MGKKDAALSCQIPQKHIQHPFIPLLLFFMPPVPRPHTEDTVTSLQVQIFLLPSFPRD